MIEKKCMTTRLPGSQYKYKGVLIGFVPAKNPQKEYEHSAGDKQKMTYTVDALVMLAEMDYGRIVQVPMFDVEIVDKYPTREE